ncbi:MAG: hypothetical protein LBN09_02800 [Clostridioides sp.]|jgi:hypothetical protein|nr:hypothetical protein [Clostridioides sp.]
MGKNLDEQTYLDVSNNDLDFHTGDEDLNFKIVYNDISTYKGSKAIAENVKGPWIFEFTTNSREIAKDTYSQELNTVLNLSLDFDINFKKYTSNNLGQKIYAGPQKGGVKYDLELRGKDDLGNDVVFYLSSGDENRMLFENEKLNGNIDEQAKILTLKPYAVNMPETSGKMSNDFKPVGESFTIDLTK